MNSEADHRISLTIVTGFLGSGKTTLIRSLLTEPRFANAAIIVNEFGEVGIDHHLFFQTEERITLLGGGCACCALRDDLVDALHSLLDRFDRNEDPRFDSVVLETTGLADPAPILHTILMNPLLGRRVRLDQVITTIDAVAGWDNLDRYVEAVRQVTTADTVVVTKSDLAPSGAAERLVGRLTGLNPSANVCLFRQGRIDSQDIAPSQEFTLSQPTLHEPGSANKDSLLHSSSENVSTLCLEFDTPLDWPMLGLWLTLLLHRHGERVLRVKGLLDVDQSGPLLLEGVQHVVHAPRHLRQWPGGNRRSRIVFIVRELDPELIRASLQAYQALAHTV